MSAADDSQTNGRTSATVANQLENIKVAVRLRPFTDKEKQKNNKRIVDIEQSTVVLYSPRNEDSMKKFTFDYSYWSHDGFKRDSSGINVPDASHPNSAKYVGQEKVFEDLGQFLLDNALKGYSSALLAYGQTGSGKSYTVSGYGQNEGILPRFARALFVELNKKARVLHHPDSTEDANILDGTRSPEGQDTKSVSNNNRYEVFFSMIEIYNEVVRDLLAKGHPDSTNHQHSNIRRGLKVREHPKHGFFVENLTSFACANREEIEQRIADGHLNKSIASTSMNETSSRGHTIYEFQIKQYKLKSADTPEESLTTSVVQLVDLAGSERMAVHVTGDIGGDTFIGGRSSSPFSSRMTSEKVTSNRDQKIKVPSSASSTVVSSARQQQLDSSFMSHNQQRFKESISINQSLSALGNCIQVLSQYSQQLDNSNYVKKSPPKIPYRDSVLTKLLNRCCLSGNSKVVIIATLSPADTNYDDTLSTLRFADRAKQIRIHATINRSSRGDIVDTLHKENERLRQMVDGRATRSDDSSQTSNFDELESVAGNFNGSRLQSRASNNATGGTDLMATPVRSRTSTRKAKYSRQTYRKGQTNQDTNSSRMVSASSNPSLVVREQMKRLVSPASKKLTSGNLEVENESKLRKSRSMGHGLASKHNAVSDYKLKGGRKVANMNADDLNNDDELDINDLGDFGEGLISPDSDEDSLSALVDDDLTNDEKITLLNRLLSDSTMTARIQRGDKRSLRNNDRLTNGRTKGTDGETTVGLKHMSKLSSTLKLSNPYMSNLNPDEQLTGMISYIIKLGETIVGKSNDCDVVLHGPELRARHARLTRESGENGSSSVFIEPILDTKHINEEESTSLMINGQPVLQRTKLNHCDRLRFGTNAYFVFIDTMKSNSENTLADLDMVTYDMARGEVLRKLMLEEKNEAMIKEIKDYTHRPGTGKHRVKSTDNSKESRNASKDKQSEQQRQGEAQKISDSAGEGDKLAKSAQPGDSGDSKEDNYKNQLMEDTYEYAMPVAEVNAVAKEMGIKVNYGLKILTGEEQLPDLMMATDSESNGTNSADGSAKRSNKDEETNSQTQDQVTKLDTIDYLDLPPALYIKVHLEEQDLEFYWSKEKFQARRFKMLELYSQWDVGGKSALVEYLIDQSRILGNYLIDPFVDEPYQTPILIGHSQITLQPISHLSDMHQSYDILDINDEIVGTISVQAIPCHTDRELDHNKQDAYRPFTEDDLIKNILSNPAELLGKSLVFLLRIISCRDIPDRFTNVFCQYSFNPNSASIKSKVLRSDQIECESLEQGNELLFQHSHYIYYQKVDQDFLDFLQDGFLTIQVVGNYRSFEPINRSPTVISTIISSIQKYKFRMENSYNYSNSATNSNSDSAKSMREPSSAVMNSNSGSGSVVSASATVNLFDQQNDDDENANSVDGLSQENIIDMILTKRKLDRAENQLHYLKRTVNIAEHYNKKHIPVKTVKKLLNSHGHDLDSGSLEEMATEVALKGGGTNSKHSGCSIQ